MNGIIHPTLLVDIECFMPRPKGLSGVLYAILLYFKIDGWASALLTVDKSLDAWVTAHEKMYTVYLFSIKGDEYAAQKMAAQRMSRYVVPYTMESMIQQANFIAVHAIVTDNPDIESNKTRSFESLQ